MLLIITKGDHGQARPVPGKSDAWLTYTPRYSQGQEKVLPKLFHFFQHLLGELTDSSTTLSLFLKEFCIY